LPPPGAVREGEQAAGLVRRQAAGALEHPVGVLGLGEGVDVEDGLPGGLGGAVALQRRLAPQAAHVIGVLPEVAQGAVAGERDARHAVLGVEDRKRLGLEVGVAGVTLQHAQAARVLGLGPVEGAGSLDLLHPQIGIVLAEFGERGAGLGRLGVVGGDRGGQGHQARGS